MNSLIVSLAVIQNTKGEYLLTQRYSPEYPEVHLKWQLVGGVVKFGETTEQAIERECQEEIGNQIKIVLPYPSLRTHIWHHTGEEPTHTLLLCYLCKLENENNEIFLNEESHSYAWFRFGELHNLDKLPHTLEIIQELKALKENIKQQ